MLYQDTPAGGVNNIYLGSKLIAKDGFIPNPGGTQNHRPYGSSIEGEADDIGYTGHKFDTDLGLSYMQARYYDPVIGRFYSNDPVGYRDVLSFNRYAYANNNPYRFIDPTGMCSEEQSDSEISCQAQDELTDILEPLMEELLKALDLGVVPEGERDPDGEFAHSADENSIGEEVLAIGIIAAKAKLTGGGKKKIGNLGGLKDKSAAEAFKQRGGGASQVNQLGEYSSLTVGQLANMAAAGDKKAETAMKIIKQASKKSQKYGGK
ncbi:RHS repeat-associated core domain-containing protein [Aestuariibacter sp. AA17]|uniref:RHS repeat-associated core domain-containing protein n=1 Tax=Fluctibacter corallii TaxID=2984329 RepID=A0ABT3ACT0_9ALTE|nr:RHS repeat-associated core domain-containing protein [Aestuariibacter sp. AA17]MCV2886482.1 RHS repeat-associated core domain-containing protein [Aestuariibacter sp. AA17]